MTINLEPERTASFDFGVEQRAFGGKLSLDATYFYNRFYDLIVSLGGNLAVLSAFQSDNLSNARAQGAEFSARLRPDSDAARIPSGQLVTNQVDERRRVDHQFPGLDLIVGRRG